MSRVGSGRANITAAVVKVAICGNPNSGKTTIFNAVTGLNQRVANYPGVTVEKVIGRFSLQDMPGRQFELIDVPGAYSLVAFSPDEYIATSALFSSDQTQPAPDAVVCVIDATNLERGLYLVLQVLEIGRPVVLVLNMWDVVRRRGIQIDIEKLSQELGGMPVIPVVGNRGIGISELKEAIASVSSQPWNARHNTLYDAATERLITELQTHSGNGYCTRAECLRVIFDLGGPAEKRYLQDGGSVAGELLERGRQDIRANWEMFSAAETTPLTRRAAELCRMAVTHPSRSGRTRSERVDRFLLHPVLGPVVLLAIMVLVFQSIFSWAEPFMTLIDDFFGMLATATAAALPEGPLQSLVTDGIIGGVGSVLIFIPQIAILFIFIALLEDSGYMTRAAFLVDRLFRWCGLSGKSFIPMLSSFACAVPGIMATRTIEDRKLRIITIMVSPLMTCSARLPVYAVMIAAFVPYKSYLGLFNLQGIVLTSLYLLGIAVAVAVSFVLSRSLFRAERTTFMMEMPGYKLPTLRSMVVRVLNRVKSFVTRAGTVILAITVIIWAISYYPHSQAVEESFSRQETLVRADYESVLMVAQANLERTTADSPAADNAVGRTDVNAASRVSRLESERDEALRRLADERAGALLRNSFIGRLGRAVQPVFRPLGWDWKITVATLASFPAREVVIATLGTIYNIGSDDAAGSETLVERLRQASWQSGARSGEPVFTLAVAL
ncbi:MAG: ferrous iron transport protein B, partial [Candidatus Zixiibacteriota bacterium]